MRRDPADAGRRDPSSDDAGRPSQRDGRDRPQPGVPRAHRERLGVSIRVTWAVARRVLWQIRRDPRTIALLLVVPVLLLVLLKYVFAGETERLPNDRRPALRPVPVHRHVPDHVDRDAPRAHERDARAADDPADVAPRSPGRLRHRVRPARGDPGDRRLHGRVPRARPGRRPRRLARRAPRDRERAPRNGARARGQRVRADRVPGRPVHAGAHLPAAAPLRPLHRAQRDGHRPLLGLVGAPAHLLLRRARPRHRPRRARRVVRPRRPRHRLDHVRGPRPRRATLKRRTA